MNSSRLPVPVLDLQIPGVTLLNHDVTNQLVDVVMPFVMASSLYSCVQCSILQCFSIEQLPLDYVPFNPFTNNQPISSRPNLFLHHIFTKCLSHLKPPK